MKIERVNESTIFVSLQTDEDINSELLRVIEQEQIPSGSVSGIGAIEGAELGYYDMVKDEYRYKSFHGEFELSSCMGNISWLDGAPVVHLHAVISDENFASFGGHLVSAKISATGEFFINVGTKRLERKKKGTLALIKVGK